MAPLLLLLALTGLAIAAAQVLPFPPISPPPPQQQQFNTDAADEAALSAVFGNWSLGYETGNPCGNRTRVWFESLAKNASISCRCDGGPCRITHLNVTGHWNLTPTLIPQALFNLTELVSLDLSNNKLSGPIPRGIANLSKLETWHFNNNQLNGTFPNDSSSLRSLQSLWMFDNNIEGTLPEFIGNFISLTDLRIYGTKLQGPIPKKISNLTNLEKLMLGDLHGGNSTFEFRANWANLSTLSLRKCGIIGQLPNTLPDLTKLTYLDLGSNNLSGPVEPLRPYNLSLYIGGNNFSGTLPSEMAQSSRPLDVSYNPFLSGSLPNNPPDQKRSINYIGTSIDASRTINSENLTLLNCLHMKECSINNDLVTSCAVNCGGNKLTDSSSNMFDDDTSELGEAGFHVNTDKKWVVSQVGSDPFGDSPGKVNTSLGTLGTHLHGIYQTARTSRSDLWYYVVGLSNGNYTVQLFFAEIVIDSNVVPGRRSFDIDIQDQNIITDFDISKEAGGFGKPTNITHEATVDKSVLKIHLYWNGRGTRAIPYEGAYGPLVSGIRVFRPEIPPNNSPPPAPPESVPQDNKRRGVVAGIAALGIAVAVISSSVVYLWWKWVSLVKHPNA